MLRGVLFCWLLLVGCAPLEPLLNTGPASYSLSQPERTPLGRQLQNALETHTDQSGFRVLDQGEEALLWRGVLTDAAVQSIDVQYFIWKDDNVGTLAAERLLRAAERGVRVRVLVDDLPLTVQAVYLQRLDAHPKIEIRRYNPSGATGSETVKKMLQVLANMSLLNRRMHNKALIIDGSIAIVGGRNIADEYYDMLASDNFRDRDVLAVGPIVADIAQSFDEFWNSDWVRPLPAPATSMDSQELTEYYKVLQVYARDPGHVPPRFEAALQRTRRALNALPEGLHWGNAELVYDPPGKNTALNSYSGFGESGRHLTEVIANARTEVLAQTPYLILPQGAFEVIESLRQRGVTIRLNTNSLATTDSLPAFSGYARQRERLLKLGVELYELRHDAELRQTLIQRFARLSADSVFALHAKTAVIDRRWVYIGSFNMDPRSTHLNTELGILIDSPQLAAEVAAILIQDMYPANSWRLSLNRADELTWTGRTGERFQQGEPGARFSDGLTAFLLSLLPLNHLL